MFVTSCEKCTYAKRRGKRRANPSTPNSTSDIYEISDLSQFFIARYFGFYVCCDTCTPKKTTHTERDNINIGFMFVFHVGFCVFICLACFQHKQKNLHNFPSLEHLPFLHLDLLIVVTKPDKTIRP